MDELPDISTMKVAELKKELKARGLPTTGNKVELVDRLQLAVAPAEDSSDILDEENDLLADDPAPSSDDKSVEAEAPPADDPSSSVAAADSPSAASGAKPKDSPAASSQTQLEAKEPAAKEVLPDTTPTGKKRITAPDETSSPTKCSASADGASDESDKAKPLTDAERVAARVARFGPTTSTDLEEKKAARAERFKLPTAGSDKIGASPSVDVETLKKRADRFGQSSSTTLKKMEMEEQLNKRKERFGEEASSTVPEKKAKVVINENLLVDEKMKKRAERFGTPEVKA